MLNGIKRKNCQNQKMLNKKLNSSELSTVDCRIPKLKKWKIKTIK
jgi:hypothetical protein